MANSIRSYFGDGSDFGVRMVYATEESPLGTAGSVRNAIDELDERFLVISGDVLTDLDLTAIVAAHEAKQALATIALVRVENPLEFGIVITREDGSIERFLEKPSWGQVFSDTINTGIFVLEPEIFDYIEPDRSVDFSSEVFPAILADGKRLFGAVAEGYWEDVGTLESYLSAHKDILDGRVAVDIPGFEMGDGVHVGEGAEVHPDATLVGPAVIGENCRIEAGVRLGPYTVLGTNVRVRANADLERVVVHDNSYLGESVRLRGATIGRSCDLRRGVRGEEGVVLGRRVLRRRAGRPRQRREGVPVQDRRAGRGHQLVDRVGEPRVPLAVRPRRCRRARQRRHHPRAGHPGGDGLRHHAQEGQHDHHLAGLEPVRADAQAGDDGRRQRGRGERARPRGRLRACHPVHRAPSRARWWSDHPPRRGGPPELRDPVLRCPRV